MITLHEKEQLLARKEAYASFTSESEDNLTSQLSHLLNQAGDSQELLAIRYMQGEYYFHCSDYETAIFKWEKVTDTVLHDWAMKNIADTYRELRDFKRAESLYQAITPNASIVLKLENDLSLFALYREDRRIQDAVKLLHQIVAIDPEYKEVNFMALDFFEAESLYHDALLFIVSEIKRLQDANNDFWIMKLREYIQQERIQMLYPGHLTEVIKVLFAKGEKIFNEVISMLWESYRSSDKHVLWLHAFNFTYKVLENEGYDLKPIASHYQPSFHSLMFEEHDIKEVKNLMPTLLKNWWKISKDERPIIQSYMFAWNDVFLTPFSKDMLADIKDREAHNHKEHILFLQDVSNRFLQWIKQEDFLLPNGLNWWVHYLQKFEELHLFVAGTFSNGKSSVINTIVGEELLETEVLPTTSTMVVLEHQHEQNVQLIHRQDIKQLDSLEDFKTLTTINHDSGKGTHTKGFVHFALPNPRLEMHSLSLIDSPGFNDNEDGANEVLDHLNLADGILFVLNARTPFTKEEKIKLLEIHEKNSDIPLHFLLNKIDIEEDEEDAEDLLEDTNRKVKKHFKNALVQPFSSLTNTDFYINEFMSFVDRGFRRNYLEHRGKHLVSKLLEATHYIKEEDLIRVEKEYNQSIKKRLKLVADLNVEKQQIREYCTQQKELLLQELHKARTVFVNRVWETVPPKMRACTRMLRPDSNLQTVHLDINQYMNQEIKSSWEQELKPALLFEIKRWLDSKNASEMRMKIKKHQFQVKIEGLVGKDMSLHYHEKFLSVLLENVESTIYEKQLKEIQVLPLTSPMRMLTGVQKIIGGSSQSFFYNRYKKQLEENTFIEAVEGIFNQVLSHFDHIEEIVKDSWSNIVSSLEEQIEKEVDFQREVNQEEIQALSTFKEQKQEYIERVNLYAFAVKSMKYYLEKNAQNVPEKRESLIES